MANKLLVALSIHEDRALRICSADDTLTLQHDRLRRLQDTSLLSTSSRDDIGDIHVRLAKRTLDSEAHQEATGTRDRIHAKAGRSEASSSSDPASQSRYKKRRQYSHIWAVSQEIARNGRPKLKSGPRPKDGKQEAKEGTFTLPVYEGIHPINVDIEEKRPSFNLNYAPRDQTNKWYHQHLAAAKAKGTEEEFRKRIRDRQRARREANNGAQRVHEALLRKNKLEVLKTTDPAEYQRMVERRRKIGREKMARYREKKRKVASALMEGELQSTTASSDVQVAEHDSASEKGSITRAAKRPRTGHNLVKRGIEPPSKPVKSHANEAFPSSKSSSSSTAPGTDAPASGMKAAQPDLWAISLRLAKEGKRPASGSSQVQPAKRLRQAAEMQVALDGMDETVSVPVSKPLTEQDLGKKVPNLNVDQAEAYTSKYQKGLQKAMAEGRAEQFRHRFAVNSKRWRATNRDVILNYSRLTRKSKIEALQRIDPLLAKKYIEEQKKRSTERVRKHRQKFKALIDKHPGGEHDARAEILRRRAREGMKRLRERRKAEATQSAAQQENVHSIESEHAGKVASGNVNSSSSSSKGFNTEDEEMRLVKRGKPAKFPASAEGSGGQVRPTSRMAKRPQVYNDGHKYRQPLLWQASQQLAEGNQVLVKETKGQLLARLRDGQDMATLKVKDEPKELHIDLQAHVVHDKKQTFDLNQSASRIAGRYQRDLQKAIENGTAHIFRAKRQAYKNKSQMAGGAARKNYETLLRQQRLHEMQKANPQAALEYLLNQRRMARERMQRYRKGKKENLEGQKKQQMREGLSPSQPELTSKKGTTASGTSTLLSEEQEVRLRKRGSEEVSSPKLSLSIAASEGQAADTSVEGDRLAQAMPPSTVRHEDALQAPGQSSSSLGHDLYSGQSTSSLPVMTFAPGVVPAPKRSRGRIRARQDLWMLAQKLRSDPNDDTATSGSDACVSQQGPSCTVPVRVKGKRKMVQVPLEKKPVIFPEIGTTLDLNMKKPPFKDPTAYMKRKQAAIAAGKLDEFREMHNSYGKRRRANNGEVERVYKKLLDGQNLQVMKEADPQAVEEVRIKKNTRGVANNRKWRHKVRSREIALEEWKKTGQTADGQVFREAEAKAIEEYSIRRKAAANRRSKIHRDAKREAKKRMAASSSSTKL